MTIHMVKRSLTLLALSGIVACTGDPTGDLANGVDHLEANPSTFYLVSGATTNVDVTARDGAGNPVETTFSVAPGAGVTVVRDETFEPIRNSNGDFVPNPHPTRIRYNVTATAAAAFTSFTVTGGGKDQEVAVVVTPTNAGTISATTGAVGDVITVTAASGLRFPADVGALFGTAPGFVTDVAADGSSFDVSVAGGFHGLMTVTGAEIIGLEGTGIDVPVTDTVNFTAGTDDPTTGPTIVMPTVVGDSTVIFDNFVEDPDQFYTILTTAPVGNYTISVDWSNDADFDLFGCLTTAPTCASAVAWSAGGDQPETITLDLGGTAATTGTMRIVVELFGGDVPDWIKITIKKNS